MKQSLWYVLLLPVHKLYASDLVARLLLCSNRMNVVTGAIMNIIVVDAYCKAVNDCMTFLQLYFED